MLCLFATPFDVPFYITVLIKKAIPSIKVLKTGNPTLFTDTKDRRQNH